MQPPYKIEIFDREIQFKAFSPIEPPEISFDYLTLEQSTITTPIIAASKGDYAHITDAMGAIVFQGTVADISRDKKRMKLSVKPLLGLLDLTVGYDRRDLQNGALEAFIAGIITNTFITNSDVLQNIYGLEVVTLTATTGTKLNIKSNVHEFYDIITKAFTMYKIAVNAELRPGARKLIMTIGVANPDNITVESELRNVIDKSIIIGDNYGQLNKVVYINKNDESQTVTYYLHSDGTVNAVDADRISPVFLATEYIETDDDFLAEAEKRASESLVPQQYDNLIEVTYRNGDTLLDLSEFKVGRTATIIDTEAYSTILTGYEWTNSTTKLIFGNVRVDLTKKLILERRRGAND